MSPSVFHFSLTELRLRKGLPYFFAALLLFWFSFVLPWQLRLLIPGIVFLGIGAAVWSAMRYGFYHESGGRLASRERILDMLPKRIAAGCPRARNLKLYLMASPVFWVLYAVAILFILLETLT